MMEGFSYKFRDFNIRTAPLFQRRDASGNAPLGMIFEVRYLLPFTLLCHMVRSR